MENIQNTFSTKENENKNLLSHINLLSSQVEKYKAILKNINFITEEFKTQNNVKSYVEVINRSFLNPDTKKEYISHFKLYENYIADKNREEIVNSYKEDREPNLLNLYCPENAWELIRNNKKLSNSTKKKRLKQFLNILRKDTSDASPMYNGNFPRNTKSKIKH